MAYKISKIENFDVLIIQFKYFSAKKYLLLLFAVILLPVNVLLESSKWKTLLQNIFAISFITSIKSVLWGYTGAFITPNSLGEFPTRALNLPEGYRIKAVAIGFLGSIAQTVSVTFFGLIGLIFWQFQSILKVYLPVLIITFVFLLLFAWLFFRIKTFSKIFKNIHSKFLSQIYDSLQFTTSKQLIKVFFISFFKYLIFSLQFYLILLFCGVEIPFTAALITMPVFYLFLTYLPLINAFEVAVRSSVAIFIFGKYCNYNSLIIIAASTIFWLLNFCLPTSVGLLFGKKYGIVEKNS